MEDIRTLVRAVLEKGHLMSLGIVDGGGPWVADVIYVFDDEFNLYWMSDPDARHSQALLDSPSVAGTITVSNAKQEPNLGIQFAGIARKLEGSRSDLALKHFAKRGKPAPQEDADVLQGDAWYELVPKKIELIDEEHFGFEKRQLVL
jgi:uncharacterized protein YhbP (UPF0306 family)